LKSLVSNLEVFQNSMKL